MRRLWPFFLAIAVLGCKDKEPPKPAEAKIIQPAPAATGSGAAATSAPARPTLPPAEEVGSGFAGEAEDKAWATTTEAAIHAAAPELAEVECHQRQCRATLVATSEPELVAKAEKLQTDESLRATGARSVLLTAPTVTDGKREMKLFVRYDR